jgi:hypothetical protein
MSAKLLDSKADVQCPHGGKAELSTANPVVRLGQDTALLATDEHPITGCPFQLPGPKPSPCVKIRWSGGSGVARLDGGAALLLASSVGECLNAEGVSQGTAVVVRSQSAVTTEG